MFYEFPAHEYFYFRCKILCKHCVRKTHVKLLPISGKRPSKKINDVESSIKYHYEFCLSSQEILRTPRRQGRET